MTSHNPLPDARRWLVSTLLCLCMLCGCTQSNQSETRKNSLSRTTSEFDEQRDRPPSAMTLYSMAEILATQGKDRECEFVLRRCIQEHPRFMPAYNGLAELHMRQGRPAEAVSVLSEALQIHPRDPVLLNNQGMCLLVHKDYEKSLERFTAAAGLMPVSEKYRGNMATALGLMGRQEEALALLRQILPEEEAKSNAEVLRVAHENEVRPVPSSEG